MFFGLEFVKWPGHTPTRLHCQFMIFVCLCVCVIENMFLIIYSHNFTLEVVLFTYNLYVKLCCYVSL